MICGLMDGYIFIDCLYKCYFCVGCSNDCNCINFSLVDIVMDLEILEKSKLMFK